MFNNLGFVAPGDELHASIFTGCGFKRYPEIERLRFAVAPESIVLVPRCCGTGVRGFEEAAVVLHDDIVSEKMACDVEHCRTGVDVVPYQRRFDTEVGEANGNVALICKYAEILLLQQLNICGDNGLVQSDTSVVHKSFDEDFTTLNISNKTLFTTWLTKTKSYQAYIGYLTFIKVQSSFRFITASQLHVSLHCPNQ